jgi:glycosyltransferase involved in cell wall biosynthesis
VVVSGWPRISEVFAVNELVALHRAGMLAAVFATKAGECGLRQPTGRELDALVHHLPDTDAAGQGAVVAERLAGTGVAAVHGYFAHRPAAVAMAAATRLGIRWGFSAHALDVRKVPREEMARLAAGASVVVCCNPDAAADLRAAGVRPALVRHGVDLTRFATDPPPGGGVVRLLAVGRFVEKKGFAVLVEAMALLDRRCRLRIVGDGVLRPELEALIAARGLDDRVELVGRRTHATLPAEYAAADIVVVPSVVDAAGDRDGLPNVVLEAMASARPVVASDVAAIGTAVLHGATGLLVPPRDPARLAAALAELIDDPPRRSYLGRAGRIAVAPLFDLDRCTAELCTTLERHYG